MHDQAQAWSDRQEPVTEGAPAQRPPAEDEPAGTGTDGAWEPAEDRAVTDEDRAVENEDRAVGVASVPDGAAVPDETAAEDEAARDEDAADDEAARDEGAAWDGSAVDDEAVRDDEVRDHAALHDAAHEGPDEPLAGGVPDDAVSGQDAPVPAAACDTSDTTDTEVTDVTDAEVADSAAAGTEAGEETGAGQATGSELMPGQVPEEPVSALFDAGTAGDFRDRWQRVQMQFVDDPRAAAEQARSLVDDVVAALQSALTDQRGSLDGWQSGQAGDTEELRVAVRRYRDFLDRVLGL